MIMVPFDSGDFDRNGEFGENFENGENLPKCQQNIKTR